MLHLKKAIFNPNVKKKNNEYLYFEFSQMSLILKNEKLLVVHINFENIKLHNSPS